MNNTVILIPSHLRATRLPNKPLLLINNKPMIVHCWQRAIDSKIGEVYVATSFITFAISSSAVAT